jgi:aspartate dehydrogenase
MPEHEAQPERRLGIIGFGRIALPVVDCWSDGGLPGWTVAGVLARGSRQRGCVRSTDDADDFFSQPFDLIIEAAGPAALAAHGERALGVADVWTVSAAALADARLFDALRAAGVRAGHRLRVMPGAIAGLDGVAMAAVDPAAELLLDIDLVPGPGPRALVFTGSVREAALRYPDSVNVAAAAALAGPGLDRARIQVFHPGPVPRHRLALSATSCFGSVHASVEPLRGPGVHPVAASLIAALRAESRTIWSG